MKTSTCPSREELLGYLEGTIGEEEAARVAAHLAVCRKCDKTAEALEAQQPDTVVTALRQPVEPNPYAAEPACQQALERMQGLGAGQPAAQSPMSPPPTIPVAHRATVLGDYELLARLGQGGMGKVYKARHTRLKRIVALKVLPKERLDNPEAIARFEREMEAVGRLEHANIARAHDAREIGGVRFLVMEYIDGLDLSEIVRRVGPLSIADACEVCCQTALALECSHENGLVHRDVKPSNLMLSRSGQVKLLDLGLAQIQGHPPEVKGEGRSTNPELTGIGQVMGTPDYVAPEQVRESHTVDIRADIYSLGCTLYTLLAGQPPYGDGEYDTPMKKVEGHLHRKVPSIQRRRPDVPSGLVGLLSRMMAKEPDRRPATPGEVRDALAPLRMGSKLIGLLREAQAKGPPDLEASVGEAFETGPLSPSAMADTSRAPSQFGEVTVMAAPPPPREPVAFDPYHRWLGIAPAEQPVNHYRLLGIPLFESDSEVIRDAAARQTAHVRTYQLGAHAELSQRILNKLAAARAVLLNAKKKAEYDRQLREQRQVRFTASEHEVTSAPPIERTVPLLIEPKPRFASVPKRRHRPRWVTWIWTMILLACVIVLSVIALQRAGDLQLNSSRTTQLRDNISVPASNVDFRYLVDGVQQVISLGSPGVVSSDRDDWKAIVGSDADSRPPHAVFVAAREYGKGRVIAFGRESIADQPAEMDNARFLENVLKWLDVSGRKRLLYSTGHGEWSTGNHLRRFENQMAPRGFRFQALPGPITSESLRTSSVLYVGNAWKDFTTAEIAAVEEFVSQGGGLWLIGWGSSWLGYHESIGLAAYPMGKLGRRFGVGWSATNIVDPTNQSQGQPVFHTFYPNVRQSKH